MKNSQKLPLITIIINNFNNRKYIEQAILSAINQTYKNLQIIILDDCSTDPYTYKIYDKYKKIDQRIEIHKNSMNMHIFSSRINAIQFIRGEYTCLMDGDDYYDLDFVRHMYFFLRLKKADIVVCSFAYVIKNNLYIEKRKQFFKEKYSSDQENILNFMFENKAATYAQNLTWNKLFKSELLFLARQELIERNLNTRKLYGPDDSFINLFFIKNAKNIYIDENFIGNYYRRTDVLELRTEEKKKQYFKWTDEVYTLIYDIFMKDIPDKYKSELFCNYKETVIKTLSQFLYLFQMNINVLDFEKIKYYLNIDDSEVNNIKNKINSNSNNSLIPFTIKYDNRINEIKKEIINNNNIEFNLVNGLFNCLIKDNKIIYYSLNEKIYDCLILSLYLKKNINIYCNYDETGCDTLKVDLENKLNNIFDKDWEVSFIKINKDTMNDNKFSLKIGYNKIRLYSLEDVWVKSYNYLFIRKIFKNNNQEINKFKILFYICLIITNDYASYYSKSIFNYSFEFFYLFFISIWKYFHKNNDNLKDKDNLNFINVLIDEKTINKINDTFLSFQYKKIVEKEELFIQLLKSNYQDIFNEKFAILDILKKTLLNNLSNWYESMYVLSSIFSYDNKFLKAWCNFNKKKYKKFVNINKNIYRLPFVKEVMYLINDSNIFRVEMYKFMRKHKLMFELVWKLTN